MIEQQAVSREERHKRTRLLVKPAELTGFKKIDVFALRYQGETPYMMKRYKDKESLADLNVKYIENIIINMCHI